MVLTILPVFGRTQLDERLETYSNYGGWRIFMGEVGIPKNVMPARARELSLPGGPNENDPFSSVKQAFTRKAVEITSLSILP